MAKTISSLNVVLGATVAPFAKSLSSAGASLKSFTSSVSSMGTSLVRFTGIGAAIGGVLSAFGGIRDGISLASSLEQNAIAFGTMLGSASKARRVMEDLKTFAAETPFEFPEIATSAKQLIAFGSTAGSVTSELRMLGDISAGIGAPLSELSTIYGKLRVQGRAYTQDIKEFQGRGIPVVQALADQFGVSTREVMKMVEAGKVGFPEVQKALQAMTGPGGKFAGLMEAQSKSMGGLWSTLSDNISLTTAGIVATIYKAFNLSGVLQGLIAFTGKAGAAIQDFALRAAGPIIAAGDVYWRAVVGTWEGIRNAVLPILSQIGEVIAANWSGILATTVTALQGIWSFTTSVYAMLWGAATTLWNGLVKAFAWGAGMLGFHVEAAGVTTGSVFETIVDWGKWMLDGIGTVLSAIGYFFQNWKGVVEYVGLSVILTIVRIAGEIGHAFGTVIPGWLFWLRDNWMDVLKTMADFSGAIFTNLFTNLVNVLLSLPDLISGKKTFADIWRPLTDGFESSIKALPQIAARVPSELEDTLSAQTANLGAGLYDGLGEHLAKAQADAKSATASISSAIDGAITPMKSPVNGDGVGAILNGAMRLQEAATALDLAATMQDPTKQAAGAMKRAADTRGPGIVAADSANLMRTAASRDFLSRAASSSIATAAQNAIGLEMTAFGASVQRDKQAESVALQKKMVKSLETIANKDEFAAEEV